MMSSDRLIIGGFKSLRTRAADELLMALRDGPVVLDEQRTTEIIAGLQAVKSLRGEGWPIITREDKGTHYWSLPWHLLDLDDEL